MSQVGRTNKSAGHPPAPDQGGNAMKHRLSVSALALALGCGAAQAQVSDGVIRIGVMTDMAGLYSDISGPGSVVAARMAVEDSGLAAKGIKIEVLGADHQNKPDVGSNIVRRWIDVDKVDEIGRASCREQGKEE